MSHLGRRDYAAAVTALNTLQTNWSVIDQIYRQKKPIRDEALVPEMLEWVRRIGYSPRDFNRLNVLHVTGTKGKGSTCAFAQSALLRAAPKLKVGLYTSPHLKTVRERIMIGGEPISQSKFAQYFFDVWSRLENSQSDPQRFPRMGSGVKPSYFRYLTLVSLHAFMKEGVDSAIYEVGIGGEYDSTNVFESPKATAVTSLGIDHVNVLGSTLGEIAWNKAGIFRKGVPAFTISDQPYEAMSVLRARAEEKGAHWQVVEVSPEIAALRLDLQGEFQRKNAAIAAQLVGQRLHIDPSSPEILEGLQSASWPGRCQVLETKNARWFVDGAHTMESLDVSAEWLAHEVDTSKPISLVFNQQKRDNVDALITALYVALRDRGITVAQVYFTTNQSFASGWKPEMISHNVSKEQIDRLVIQKQLAAKWQELSPSTAVHVCSNIEDVVSQVHGQVFATGSLLMVGSLLAVIDPTDN